MIQSTTMLQFLNPFNYGKSFFLLLLMMVITFMMYQRATYSEYTGMEGVIDFFFGWVAMIVRFIKRVFSSLTGMSVESDIRMPTIDPEELKKMDPELKRKTEEEYSRLMKKYKQKKNQVKSLDLEQLKNDVATWWRAGVQGPISRNVTKMMQGQFYPWFTLVLLTASAAFVFYVMTM